MLYKGAPPFSMSALYIIMNFNPRAPYGARPNIRGVWMWWHSFNPRAPCRARPANLTIGYLATTVSIHAPHAGRDHASPQHSSWTCSFNPRAPCGARQGRHRLRPWQHPVSIPAPRVGRDGNWSHDFPLLPRIYGHSPPQIRFSRHLRPTPLLRHDSRTYIFTFCFLFTSPSHSVMNAQMMIAASKS